MTVVDFEEKTGRFVISCPVWDNDRVRALPNRRWNKGRRAWLAPAVRANVQCIRASYSDTELTDRARCKIGEYSRERSKKAPRSLFPPFYVFKRKPRPVQQEALDKVYGQRAFALFMDMRTGKTKVFIDAVCAMRMEGHIDKVILIAPLSLRKNWIREIEKDAPIPVDAYLLDTSKPKNFDAWMSKKHDFKWLLVGVESLAAGRAIEFCKRYAVTSTRLMCGVDESSRIKSHDKNRSKAAVSLARMSEYRAIMTGTPLTKSPLDLFMQFEFLDPDIFGFGDYYSYRARYAELGGYGGKEVLGYNNLDELAELVAPHVFQVRQEEVINHTKTCIIREVKMSPEQRELYRQMARSSKIVVEDRSLAANNILEKALRLMEITGGFVSLEYSDQELNAIRDRLGPQAKLPRTFRKPIPGNNPKLADLLEATEEYQGKTIIWCSFVSEIAAVVEELRRRYGHDAVTELHGAISEADRDRNVYELFQKGPARFIVGNAATGGMGLTMDAADNVFFYSNTHLFGDREQAEERATADNKATLVVDFVCEGTVDVSVMRSNLAKKDLAEFIRDKISEAGTVENAAADVLAPDC